MEDRITQKSWFSRNWGWVIPLGGCLTIIVLFFVFIGSLIFGVSKVLTESTPYKDAIIKVQEDDYVVEILGKPIEANGIMQGSVSLENSNGTANIAIPIKGPKGDAHVYLIGSKQNNEWTYTELYVIIKETDEQIDLLGYNK